MGRRMDDLQRAQRTRKRVRSQGRGRLSETPLLTCAHHVSEFRLREICYTRAMFGRSQAIEQYGARAVFRGLLQGAGYSNRVGGSCVYGCPRCGHRIRFRWRSFYQASGGSPFQRRLRRAFDDMTPESAAGGWLDFHCPTCRAPTRIVYHARDSLAAACHFDIYAALVGAGTNRG